MLYRPPKPIPPERAAGFDWWRVADMIAIGLVILDGLMFVYLIISSIFRF